MPINENRWVFLLAIRRRGPSIRLLRLVCKLPFGPYGVDHHHLCHVFERQHAGKTAAGIHDDLGPDTLPVHIRDGIIE